MKRDERVNFENTSFFGMLKIVRLGTLTYKNFGFYFGLVIAFIFLFITEDFNEKELIDLAEYITGVIPSVAAALLGIIIAGLAIIVALSTEDIYNKLLKNRTLQKLLFPFWYVAALWAITTFSVISLGLIQKFLEVHIIYYLIVFIIFILNYALVSTIKLIGNTIRIMVYLAQLKK
ncbi:hypothetical protein SH601_11590 [Gracilibacillus sp. S3-1-1]|uniref:Uncharacterized protein n=1 Tax=Gracilibacillus pellucidus TaxID=3095368 RepID=A0ACC6M6N5_9BACI|nr:hypothetical protein [Gracilibacillus sp. S3-1-1]MDX8046624.1 hypothetical protein [Gracilibacillus sp. S3-1-1]